MADTFNPFANSQSLAAYLDTIERQPDVGATPNDPNTGIAIEDFLTQSRESEVVPEFTDQAGLSPDKEKALNQFVIDTKKNQVKEDVGLTPEDFDLSQNMSALDAANKAEDIRMRAIKAGRRLEKEHADEIGLTALQDRYNQLLAIPGATGFDTVRNELANLEDQIIGKQSQLDKFIAKDRDGAIVGEMGEAFLDAQQLANQWDRRSKELGLLESRRAKGEERLEAGKLQAITSVGGEAQAQKLAGRLGITEGQLVDRLLAKQVNPQVLAMHDFEVQRGRDATFEEAAMLFGPEASKVFIDELKREGKDVLVPTLEKISQDVNNTGLVDAMVDDMRKQRMDRMSDDERGEERRRLGDLTNAEKKAERESDRAFAKQALYQEGIQMYREKVKKEKIVPDTFSLENDPFASPEEKTSSVFLVSMAPQAFTYNPDIGKWAQDIMEARELFERNPARQVSFEQVFSKMYGAMAESIDAPHLGTGIEVLSALDMETSQLQMMLAVDAAQRQVPGNNIPFIRNIQRGIQGMVGATPEPEPVDMSATMLEMIRSAMPPVGGR